MMTKNRRGGGKCELVYVFFWEERVQGVRTGVLWYDLEKGYPTSVCVCVGGVLYSAGTQCKEGGAVSG